MCFGIAGLIEAYSPWRSGPRAARAPGTVAMVLAVSLATVGVKSSPLLPGVVGGVGVGRGGVRSTGGGVEGTAGAVRRLANATSTARLHTRDHSRGSSW